MLMATLVRFSPKFGAAGERGSIELVMRVTSLVGLAALAVYAVTTEWGQERFGIAAQELASRERTLAILRVLWLVLLLCASVPMLFAEASLRPMRRAERPESRRVRAAAAAGLPSRSPSCTARCSYSLPTRQKSRSTTPTSRPRGLAKRPRNGAEPGGPGPGYGVLS